MTVPERGFPDVEFRRRTAAAQAAMQDAGLSALLLTTEPEVRYYTGFLTRFWESPTRPWFVILPASGGPIAVIPSIGAHLMGQTWVADIRTWQAPDYADDGIGLLASTIAEVVPEGGKIGVADQMESHLRMPLADWSRLKGKLDPRQIVSDQAITRDLRLIKSDNELAKIRHAASIADQAFDQMSDIARVGTSLSEVFRSFQMRCLANGADWVPYVAGAAGQGGYRDLISPATDRPLQIGDVLMIDTGLVWDGYFCDFDRNYSLGPPEKSIAVAHERLITATRAAFETAKPGALMSDLFHAMNTVINPGQDDHSGVGRLGHGLGMQLTEWPSITPHDHTTLVPGMVLTLEPSIALANDKMMVHEENIVIGQNGAAYLSTPQTNAIRVL